MTTTYRQNPHIQGLECLRCLKMFPLEVGDSGLGCPGCKEEGYPVSLRVSYSVEKHGEPLLPYLDSPCLGQGNTPIVSLQRLAEALGLENVWLKNEGQSPTGSHKDRMSAFAVARAKDLGRSTVVAASSGNAGASLAAFAAAASIGCVIVTTDDISPQWAAAIEKTGAKLEFTSNSSKRWEYMQDRVQSCNWYPVTNFLNPPVGSNPFGNQGCKLVAYEILDQLAGCLPTAIIVPTARGDLLWGIFEGLKERIEVGSEAFPRLFAVEPNHRLDQVLNGVDYRSAFEVPLHSMTSIGGSTVGSK